MTFGQIMSLGYVILCDVDCSVNLFCVGPDTFLSKSRPKSYDLHTQGEAKLSDYLKAEIST